MKNRLIELLKDDSLALDSHVFPGRAAVQLMLYLAEWKRWNTKMNDDCKTDDTLTKLENNMFENRHFLPQNYWLGKDLKYFSIVANTSNINNFVDGINNFFQKKIDFPKIQTSGKEFQISLNLSQIKKLKKIYSDDYDLIGKLI